MLPTQKRVKRTKTAEEALASLMRLCARAERSSGDARRLMATWGVPEQDREGVLQRLKREKFIDDGRYAEAFVREKVNLSGWGEWKIRSALRRKGVAEDVINAALGQLSPEQSAQRLAERLKRKMWTVKYSSAYELRTKLIRYALSLGYAMDEVMGEVEAITQEIKTKEECDNFIY